VRWARFLAGDGRPGFGVYEDDHIVEYEGDMFDSPRSTGRRLMRDAFTLQSPCAPSKLIGLWNNFHALAAKIGKQEPAHPLYFIKPSTSVIGPQAIIRRPPGYTGKIVFEGELGIVIGKRCNAVQADAADDFIFGFTCVNDVTAFGILDETPDFAQWCRAKSFDTFGCLGPVISTELDWRLARVVTMLDGVQRQDYALADLIFSPQQIVSRISGDMTLLPGDVIACGTSLGAGSMKDGNHIEIRIEGIGALSNVLEPA
jgi:2-keto-4-pentenoate hydratase/2-oxohepta-3-ene-1,7-dioic acid hydratase in catechol pathway